MEISTAEVIKEANLNFKNEDVVKENFIKVDKNLSIEEDIYNKTTEKENVQVNKENIRIVDQV